MLQIWMVWRYLTSTKRFFNLTSLSAIIGLAIGVASLVIAMAVVSGFRSTLKKSVIDFSGHLSLHGKSGIISRPEEIVATLEKEIRGFQASTFYAHVEGMVAHNKKILGVLVEGVDEKTVHNVLNLKTRLVSGEFSINGSDVVIGKELAKNFDLKIGDEFRIVVPYIYNYDESGGDNQQSMKKRIQKFKVSGVIDLGKYDYNERFILSNIHSVRSLKGSLGQISGIKVKLKSDGGDAVAIANALSSLLPYSVVVRSWKEINKNLFEAIELDKIVIFLVVLIIIIAASFNVSSHLFISVLRHYADISILKTLGASRVFIITIFSLQGIVLGGIGTALGLLIGFSFSSTLAFVQNNWNVLPGEVYKLDYIQADFESLDIFLIVLVSLLICFLSTLFPAITGAKLNPVEGLRHE